MAETVTVHHPSKPDSTMRVTAKAFQAVYAGEGYVRGQYGTPEVDATDVARLQQQLADAQRQLAEANAAGSKPATANPPAKRAPRVRNRGKAATAPPPPPPPAGTPEVPSPGPADVPRTSPDDDD